MSPATEFETSSVSPPAPSDLAAEPVPVPVSVGAGEEVHWVRVGTTAEDRFKIAPLVAGSRELVAEHGARVVADECVDAVWPGGQEAVEVRLTLVCTVGTWEPLATALAQMAQRLLR